MKSFLSSAKGKVIVIASGVLVIAAVVIILLMLNSKKDSYRNISVSEIFGNVIAENSGKEYKAYKNMRLADGYALTTDRDSYSRMTLDDDKYVKLEEQSRVLFKSTGSDKSRRTTLELERGALVTEITKPLAADEDYVINTPNAVLAVRGTYYRVEVLFAENGDAYTYVYTYGGAVACRRILPDGTLVDEDVVINAGYKACIKMDEIITIYLEERLDAVTDNVDPIEFDMISDNDLVDIYNSSMNGHKLFKTSRELWAEINERGIDINDYTSVYDGGAIPPYDESADNSNGNNSGESGENSLPSQSDAESSVSSDSSSESSAPGSDGDDRNDQTPSDSDNTHRPSGDDNSRPSGNNRPSGGNDPDNSNSGAGDADSDTDNSDSASDNSDSTSRPDNSEPADEPDNSGSNSGSTPPGDGSGSGNTGSGSGSGSSHTHLFGDYISDNNATCTSDGTKSASCHLCGERNTIADPGSKLPHTEAERITQPTAEANGSRVVYCSVCGEVLEEEVIPKLERTLYMENGSIIITATGYKQGVYEELDGVDEIPYTGAYIISQRDGSEWLDEEIDLYDDVPITLDGINIFSILLRYTDATFSGTDKENYLTQIMAVGDLTLRNIKLNAVESGTNSVYIYANTLTLESGTFNIVDKNHTKNVLSADILNINGGTLYVDAINRDYGITVDEINVNGGNFLTEYTEFQLPIKFSTIKITGGRVYAVDNEIPRPLGCFCLQLNKIDVYGGFLWVHKEIDCYLTISGGCVAFGDYYNDYLTDNWVDDHNEYYCTVYDTYPGNITVPRPDGTSYIYKLAPEDAAENGKYYVWLPVQTDGVAISAENFPDEKLRDYLTENLDKNNDGMLSDAEIEDITEINVAGTVDADGGVTSLAGIEHFTNLRILHCEYNSGLTSLDVSRNTKLEKLYCNNTQITSLGLSRNTALDQLYCNDTPITALDLSRNTALTILHCPNTPIAALDLRSNTALQYLRCNSTQIVSLDVSRCGDLRQLNVSNTPITSLDVSNNTKLASLLCDYTWLTSLDVSHNTALQTLKCSNSRLPFVDVSALTSLIDFEANGNTYPLPEGIDVVFDPTSDPNFVGFDPDKVSYVYGPTFENGKFIAFTGDVISYTYDCGNGHSAMFTLRRTGEFPGIEITDEVFPDAVFRDYVSTTFDTDKDGKLSQEEMDQVTVIDVAGTSSQDGGVTSLSGIELFSRLRTLYCQYNAELTALDVSHNTGLTTLHCYNTGIAALDVSNNTALTTLYCYNTGITALNVSNNIALTRLYCYSTGITALNISNNTALTYLECNSTQITSLDVSKNIALTHLVCNSTQITSLDVRQNTKLSYLICGNRGITSLDVSQNTALTYLNCGGTNITSLDVSNNTKLEHLYCQRTQINLLDVSHNTALTRLDCYEIPPLTSLNVSNCTALKTLQCYNTQLTTLDVSDCTALTSLYCAHTQITTLDLSHNTALTYLDCYYTQLKSLDVSSNTALKSLECYHCNLPFVDISNNPSISTLRAYENVYSLPASVTTTFDTRTDPNFKGFDYTKVSNVEGATFSDGIFTGFTGDTITYTYDCGQGYSETFTLKRMGEPEGVAINAENFPDPVFREYVRENFDNDNDGTLSIEERDEVVGIDVAGQSGYDFMITSLKGIELFPRLLQLRCGYNSGLTSIDISNNTLLTKLDCIHTQISSLDVSHNTALNVLSCYNTQITFLDLSRNTTLEYLYCYNNKLPFVDISNNPIISCSLYSNVYPLPAGMTTEFDPHTDPNFKGFDYSKVSNVVGATFSGGVFGNFTGDTITYTYDCGQGKSETFTLRHTGVYIPPEGVAINDTIFPDEKFREYITSNFDDGDGVLFEEEIETITDIYVADGGITSLRGIEYFTELHTLECRNNPELVSLDISHNTALSFLDCSNTPISSLDISNNRTLNSLACNDTQITSLDVSNNTALNYLECFNCRLPFIKMPSQGFSSLYFDASGNTYPLPENVGTIFYTQSDPNFNGFDYTKVSDVVGATFSSGVFSNFTGDTLTYTYNYGLGYSVTFTLKRTSEIVVIDEENFPDPVFREYVSNNLDNGDGALDKVEIAVVADIDVSGQKIFSLKGIEYFTELGNLDCSSTKITSLDVGSNTKLISLGCNDTPISYLDVSRNTELMALGISGTNISYLDLSSNAMLMGLDCYNTPLKSLDVSKNTLLMHLSSYNCQLPFVDISNNPSLSDFSASGNNYTLPSWVTNEFDVHTDPNFNGFDPYRATDVQNAVLDQETGVFSNITGNITYTYDCGQGKSETFTLKLP